MSKERTKLKFSESVERLTSKFKLLQEQIVSVVNSLIGVVGRTEEDIADLSEASQVHERLEKLHSSIAQLKPLSTIAKLNQDIYARISKIGKELDGTIQSDESEKRQSHQF
jgi:vacuolar-type H+-ATPase subunit I/STV1